MRWLIDTSAWARRDVAEVRSQFEALLAEDVEAELVLSPTVLLELLRGPQGTAVAELRDELQASFEVLIADADTTDHAAAAMAALARHAPAAHRLPIADLITAALAHQHGCGVLHVDGDFELLAAHSSLRFLHRRLRLAPLAGEHAVAGGQRALKRELNHLLHQLPVEEAEARLRGFVADLR